MKFQYHWSVRTQTGLKTGEGKTSARDEGSAELKIQAQVAKKLKVSADNVSVSLHHVVI